MARRRPTDAAALVVPGASLDHKTPAAAIASSSSRGSAATSTAVSSSVRTLAMMWVYKIGDGPATFHELPNDSRAHSRTNLKPIRMCLRPPGRVWRAAGRQTPQPLSSQEPPLTMALSPPTGVAVHSKTCPAPSSMPKGLAPLEKVPTGRVSKGPLSWLFKRSA